MELRLHRYDSNGQRTIGRLFGHGVFLCYTLEDPVRDGPKIPGQTAIPTGRYQVWLTPSHRFKRVLPLIYDVPNFAGIRIHAGNSAGDTEGCILVGDTRSVDQIHGSRNALEALQIQLGDVMGRGEEVFLTVENAQPQGTINV